MSAARPALTRPAVRRASLRVVPLVAALSACVTLHESSGSRQTGGVVTVQLLAINDLHGYLEPPSGSNGRINSIEAGGAEFLATHLKNAVAEYPHSIVVAAGDLVGASPIMSSMFHDEPTIEALNAMSLAVASVGNHEFDEGYDEVLRLRRGGCHPRDGCQDGDGFDGARFEYLSANVVRSATRAPLFPPTAIRSVGGVKIGFIGATFSGTGRVVPPAVRRDLTFLDEAPTANAHAAELKRQGIHAIVLLIHEGLRQDGGGRALDPNGCAGVSGGLEHVVKNLTADIPVVISGHSHAFYNCQIGGHLVTSASSYGRMITRVTIDVDSVTGRVVRTSATNQVVTRDVAKDPAMSAIIGKYRTLVERTAGQVVGSVAGDLLNAPNAAGESPLGNIVADAQLAATSAADRSGAVVAFMNRGGIRTDIIAGPQASADRPGRVTYGDLYSVQPFGNVLMTFTMSGDLIKRLLEQQFDNPRPGAATMLQVSSGFTYRYRLAAPAGQRVDAESIQLNGRRIAQTDRIRVAASDFLLGGGDGFTVFAESTDPLSIVADIEALVDYFKARSPVSSPPQGRIVRTD
jgi:5'-nucleotidase